MKDGIYPIYVKDGIVYPIALTKEQYSTFRFTMSICFEKITIIEDRPLGEAVNLVNEVR